MKLYIYALLSLLLMIFFIKPAFGDGQKSMKSYQGNPVNSKIKLKNLKFKKSALLAKSLGTNNISQKNIEKALSFVIPKSMAKKMNVIQWHLRSSESGKEVISGHKYQLVNMAIDKALMRHKRTVAANLGFKELTSKRYNVTLKRQQGNGALRYGDVVALHLWKYGWLKNKKQKYGISISDDDHKPHYIWKITGGKRGAKVFTDMPFALSQMRKKNKVKEIIFCQRTYGIDLAPIGYKKCNSKLAKLSGALFGANGALSGQGLSGKLAKRWKNKLCVAAVGAAAAYTTGQTGGAAALAVKATVPSAINKCKKL